MSTNKERFTLNFRKNPVISIEKIHDFLAMANDKKHGGPITLHEVVADYILNYGPKELKRLQVASMSEMDLIKIRYERDMEKSERKISFEQYLAQKIGVKR